MSALIASLSPIAAKLYLALHLYPEPLCAPPIAQVPLKTLAADANMSMRSCSVALRDLIAHNLITRLPKRSHQPSRYQIHPLPNPHPAAPLPAKAQPIAPNTPANAQPAAPDPHAHAQPAAPNSRQTPIPAAKTHNAQPIANNSILTVTPAEEALLTNPTFLQLLIATLSPTENPDLLAAAQATLARSTQSPPQEARP